MLRVLIVSSSAKGRDILKVMVLELGYVILDIVADAASARKIAESSAASLVVIESPLLDESGEALAAELAAFGAAGIIFIAAPQRFPAANAALEPVGVFVMESPVEKTEMAAALKLAVATYNRVNEVVKQNHALQKKLDDMQLINRAKFVLMEYLRMSEQQAHKYIERQAMELRLTRRKVAENILKTYEL